MIGAWVLRLLAASRADADATTRANSHAAMTGDTQPWCGLGTVDDAACRDEAKPVGVPRSRWASDPAADDIDIGLACGGGTAALCAN
jgi:hypothetical protein